MAVIKPTFSQRDFSALLDTPTVHFQIDNYRHAAFGGPTRATITAYGEAQALWECLKLLRCPVELSDETDRKVWWGYVAAVKVRVGAIEIGLTLDSMANTVTVAYSEATADSFAVGERQTTAAVADADSVSMFGIKQALASLNSATAAQAEARRDQVLAAVKNPLPTMELSDADASLSATLECRGWWQTLDWEFYSQPAGFEGYVNTGDGVQDLGNDASHRYMAQSFQIASAGGWHAITVAANVRREGAPSDNLVMALHADSSGFPGSVIASASVAGTALSENYEWTLFDIADTDITAATTYWLVLHRDGALNANNYYLVDVNEELGYSRGALLVTATEGTDDFGDGTQVVGEAGASERAAQSFQLGTAYGWTTDSISIRMRKQGAPVDDVIVELCSDSAGAPGSVLKSATLNSSVFSGDLEWVTFTLSGSQALSPATTYWVSVRRTTGADSSNHYVLDVNEAVPYPRGSMSIYNGSWAGRSTPADLVFLVNGTSASWAARNPDADMGFQVMGAQETTEQLRTLLTAAGQFFAGILVENASGLYSSQYRSGDTTALAEAEELLKSGNSTGTRMLARVDPDRIVHIYREPISGESDYLLSSSLLLNDWLDVPVPLHLCPVAVWVRLKDVIAFSSDATTLMDPSRFFIEAAEYNMQSGHWKPEPKDVPSIWDVGQMERT